MIVTDAQFVTTRAGVYVNFPLEADPGQTHQCMALFWDYNRTVNRGEAYAADGAADLWGIGWTSYTKTHEPVAGDWASWSGTAGPYQNGGSGHVARFCSDNGDGTGQFFSQNPNAPAVIRLSLTGVQGYLRMIPLTDDELFLRALDVDLP